MPGTRVRCWPDFPPPNWVWASRAMCKPLRMVVEGRKRSKALAWLSLSLLVLGAVAFIVPVTLFALASSDKGIALGDGPTEVHAPADRTWGIYANDADNSGYSESCTATDSQGRAIALRDPGVTVSSSDTEMLDHIFTTPSGGHFTIACNAQGANVRVGPVGSLLSVLIGVSVAALLGLGGLVTGILWLTRRAATPTTSVMA